MNANELAEAMETRASIRRQATSRKSVQEGANDRLADQLEQAATMLRQQQAVIDELEEENTDLRYLIATKLEQQDGISLNSMAHPVTNTLEPSYEIVPDKLETIEIDLPSPEPVAWTEEEIKAACRHAGITEMLILRIKAFLPVRFNPTVKELTDEEIHDVFEGCLFKGGFNKYEFAKAILRKAQEK